MGFSQHRDWTHISYALALTGGFFFIPSQNKLPYWREFCCIMFSHFISLSSQEKIFLPINVIHSRNTAMFSTILKQLLEKLAANFHSACSWTKICMPQWSWAFPHDSDDKESTYNAGDSGLIPGLGRSPGEGNGYPLQYSCLGNLMDRRAWKATDHGVAESDMAERLSLHFQWSQLLAFIYCMQIFAIREKFAFYESILEPGKDVNVFKMVKNFFARESFHWKTNLGVRCTGGAPAMSGNTSGLAAFLKKATPHVIMTHCLLYRQAVAWDCQQFWKGLPPLPWKDQLYQSQRFKSFILAWFVKGWEKNINFSTACSKSKTWSAWLHFGKVLPWSFPSFLSSFFLC